MNICQFFKFSAVVLFSASLIACTSSKKSTGVWVNTDKMKDKSYKSIYVFAYTQNMEAKKIVETDVAERGSEIGYKVVKSIEALPNSFSDTKQPTKEDIVESALAAGCDAVFAISLLREEEAVKYVPGTAAYGPSQYTSFSGNFFGYYNQWSQITSTPGYYDKSKNYFIQSNLYDLNTRELMFSVQSPVYNPATLKKFSDDYVDELFEQLDKAGFFKKTK